MAGEWWSPWDHRLLRETRLVPYGKESRETAMGKGNLPVWFKSLIEVEERWQESGGALG